METLIKKLLGHSGCELYLLEFDNTFFVRKLSSSESYNQRLKNQCIKQQNFVSDSLFAPQVLNVGQKDDLFYFDMKYVPAKTLAESLSTVLITEIADIVRLLFKHSYNENQTPNPEANLIFKNKIEELENTITSSENTKKAFAILNEFDWKYAYRSPCHGDLTLENILITPDKKIYLIDFLDSFYDSWFIDISKLLQDIDLGWSFRKEKNNTNRNLRLIVAKEALMGEISKLPNADIAINSIYHLLLLNVLRIYPYSKDKRTLEFLEKALIKIFNIIETIPTGVKK